MEVCNNVQEAVIKTISKKKKKGKMVVWGDLTNSWEKREAKGKGEGARYTPLNAEFQRLARRDKKAFWSEQSKEMEKAKWSSEDTLQIAEKRREVNGKEEREKYTQLNAEFQRITRRDKKAFLSDQHK